MITKSEIRYGQGTITKYEVTTTDGYSFSCVDYGAALSAVVMPDRDGNRRNVLLQFSQPEIILEDQRYFFGKAIGRVAGRIKDGLIQIGGQTVQLPQNDGKNTLHGGADGFHHAFWNARLLDNGVEFSRLIQPDADGFPGTLRAFVTYRWGKAHQLHIDFKGINVAAGETVFNPTVHSYFNLNNDSGKGLAFHSLSIQSERRTELADDLIPTGKLLDVANTVFDFRKLSPLDQKIDRAKSEGLSGFDHPFQVSGPLIATLKNTSNGRRINLYSDRNALIVYTLNSVGEPITVNGGIQLRPYMAVALEPQTLPDAIHHPGFGSIILAENQTQENHIIYDLSVDPE